MAIKKNDLMRTRKHWRNERDHKQHEFFKEKLATNKKPTTIKNNSILNIRLRNFLNMILR